MRILLSEGSGLTSRQVATRLGELGHRVEVLSSARLCLSQFTRHVRRVHRVPPFGTHPLEWLKAAGRIAEERRIDVLFPTQEQVAVLSAFVEDVPVPTVVPPFASLRRVQDKHSAYFTLGMLGLPQPASLLVTNEAQLAEVRRFPVYVKRPVSTAESGVRRADHPTELAAEVRALGLGERGLLVQEEAPGPLAMVQAVADEGRVVAWHANLRRREGASGSAAAKESITDEVLGEHLAQLVGGLRWHGAISLDAVLTPSGPQYIDVNPRLVEPRNAWLSGVDLVEKMLALAAGGHPRRAQPGRAGVCSHQLLLAVLGAAQSGRVAVARELAQATLHRAAYAGSAEELTPAARDPLSVVPVLAASAATLVWPRAWTWFVGGAVDAYALAPEGWDEILRNVPASP